MIKARSGYIGALGVISTCAALLMALWWQYHDGLQPCSLCWAQRGEVVAILLGSVLYLWRPRAGALLVLFGALAGLVTALLQLSEVQGAAPAALSVCTITASGVPSCALAGAHRFLGVRLVDWSLAGFAFWMVLGLVALRRRGR